MIQLLTKKQKFSEIVSFDEFVKYLYRPTDPSSLGIIRFLFGLLMLVDLPEERGGAVIDVRWGDPQDCHFPLLPILQPPHFPYMAILFGIMWLGALGMMLGYKFRISAILFGAPYWYILLLDKSFWNNHSYLYGIVTVLLMGSSANHYFSIDGLLDETKRNRHVPYWNYFILKFQFFMLYFLAGLKKTDQEWLEGYSMSSLGRHWVFAPFTVLLTSEQIDYLIIHWFGFVLDLTIGFWMLYRPTRPVAMVFCACFHLMNSRLFSIGMFPYVCLATMPLFCEENWPRKLQERFVGKANFAVYPSNSCVYTTEEIQKYGRLPLSATTQPNWKHRLVVGLLLTHCGAQAFLPYSHFITKGFNTWTNGLYGYSWDMMVHSWDTVLVVVRVVDNDAGREHFLDPHAWTHNERWTKHGDMCVQYAHCIKANLVQQRKIEPGANVSIFVDVWCSLNGRFQQRMYDPHYDLLRARWSPVRPVEWLLPVLAEYSGLRTRMAQISSDVYSWSNYTDVLFIADFPGLHLENYISPDLANVTLTVLEGEVVYEVEHEELGQSFGWRLSKGGRAPVDAGVFHKVHTVSSTPACYMYVYVNRTKELLKDTSTPSEAGARETMYSPFPLIEDVHFRVHSFLRMMRTVTEAASHIVFNTSITKRMKIQEVP